MLHGTFGSNEMLLFFRMYHLRLFFWKALFKIDISLLVFRLKVSERSFISVDKPFVNILYSSFNLIY